jgi:hypothetical protein
MSRFTRAVIALTALASSLALMSSTAGAVTWTNEGAGSFHATGGGSQRHLSANTFSCTGATATGTAPADSPSSTLMTGTLTFSPCSLAGQNTFIHCNYTLTGLVFSGAALGGVTGGIVDMTCDERISASPQPGLCHISGSTPVQYTNPTVAGGTGRLTFLQSSTLIVSNFGTTNCPWGTGNMTWTEHALTTTAANTPILVRHA